MRNGALVVAVSPALAFGLAGALALGAFFAPAPARAWEVEPASSGNELALELYNLETARSLDGITVSVVSAPDWMRDLVVEASPSGPIAPGGKTPVDLRFDIAPTVVPGATASLELRVSAADGAEWRETIPLTVVGRADGIQTDCCTALEIAPTDVASPAGAAGATVEFAVASYPNPSNPGSTIRFSLAAASLVRVTIHDVGGRQVRLLDSGARDAGTHEIAWDGRTDQGKPAGSGIYFVRVEAGGRARTAKLVITR